MLLYQSFTMFSLWMTSVTILHSVSMGDTIKAALAQHGQLQITIATMHQDAAEIQKIVPNSQTKQCVEN